MVFGPKFYIYGGGRWREVDISDGRVEGWGRASFVYPKRGKVQVAKTPAVLSALRDLAAGRNSAVKDGAHLPYKKRETITKKNELHQGSACDHSHRCQHSSNNGCNSSKDTNVPKTNTGVQCVVTSDAGIQTSLPSQTLTFPESFNLNPRKRRRETSSSDENVPTKITTIATVHKDSPKKFASDKNRPISSEEHNGRTKKLPSLKLSKADSTMYDIYQRKRSNSSDSVVWVVLPKKKKNHRSKHTEYLKPKSKQISKKRKHDGAKYISSKRQQSNIKTVEQINVQSKRNNNQKATETSESSSDDLSDIALSKYCQFHPQTDQKNVDDRKKMQQDQCKELIIDETDVELLRNYLVNHANDFDLLKFDQDDEYKKQFFFKINPLVSVERCRKIAKMLRRQNQDDISLKDFASQLGLTSISEISSVPKRYRLRKSKKAKICSDKETSDSGTDKENLEIYRKGGKSNKLPRHKKAENARSEEYDSYSPNSETDSENSKEHHNIARRRSERLEKTKESKEDENHESSSKRYVTRQSGANFDKNEIKEIFSSDTNIKMRKLEDSSEAKPSKSQKEVSRRRNKVNNDKFENIDLTLSTNEESEVESNKPLKEIRGKRNNNIKNKDLAVSNDENSDFEYTKSSNNVNKKGKLHNNKTKNIDEEDTAEETTKISKEQNKKGKINVNKVNANNMKNTSLIDSNKENSDEEAPKTWKKSNRSSQNKVNTTKKKENSIRNRSIESNGESSDEETPKRKELGKRNQYKVNKNTKNNINHTDSNEDSSEVDENTIKIHRKGQVNSKINTIKRNNANNADSEVELSKSLKDTNKRVQNKANDNKIKENIGIDVLNKSETNKRILNKVNNNDINTNKRHRNETPTLRETSRNNHNKANTSRNTTIDTLESNSDDENEDFVKKRNAIEKPSTKEVKSLVAKSKRTPSMVAREYSLQEDHAIVAWVSVGGRACCVNGNRIWKELQERYYNIVGQSRSWHSLRNRYLRYILPKLGMLALPPSQEARLRAAAATGEIKSRKLAPRRNSIFGVPSLGALSRRPGASRTSSSEREPPPKRHRHDDRKAKLPSPKRVLRSSLPSSPTKAHTSPTKSRISPTKSRHSPRYSDITRHFAATHRKDKSTPNASPKSLENGKSRTKNKEPSETSLSSKRSFKLKDLPQKETEKSPEKERIRTRRLFNPSAML